ncbi:hypothetical protein MOBT1_002529 [Malassezia obtusa]|uniref:PCI domain-containing protein n=1 Tax=Malassezia obtusa TaxID=76774 RepID=A0AAF0E1A3_9BASI|nr:hypothetical protein MOBT1_002529 [Malassezia obtusa]
MGGTDVVDAFVGQFQAACHAADGAALYRCVSLAPPEHVALQAALSTTVCAPLTQSVASALDHFAPMPSQKTHDRRFRALAENVLQYFAQHGPHDVDERAFEAWVRVFSDATAIFALPDTVWFIPCLKWMALRLVALAIASDKQSGSRKYTKTIDAAGRLSKCAGLAANDRTALPGHETKRAAVLALANLSFRAYFKLNNTRLCETVLGSVQNALLMNRRNAPETCESGEEVYCMAERVTYRYYLGQIRLIQHRIQAAAQHLDWAFAHCTRRHYHNQRKILVLLVPVNLILGRYARRTLLEQFQLVEPYAQLLYFHRLGYGQGVQQELERHCDWLRTRGLYMVLAEKAMLGVWRNLFRRCLRLLPSAPASNAPPTLRLATLLQPSRLAWGDGALQPEDIECIAANLVDQVGGSAVR